MIALLIAGGASAATSDIEAIAGVYKRRATFTDMQQNKEISSEDVLEIVPYKDGSFYFRKETIFANYHSCSIAGIAKHTAANTYRYTTRDLDDPNYSCLLDIKTDGKQITFTDNTRTEVPTASFASGCHQYCGARGNINDEWDKSKKRKIRYLPLILKSEQYNDAEKRFADPVNAK